jgi:hypothetical protein
MNRDQIEIAFEYTMVDETQAESMTKIKIAARELALLMLEQCPASKDRDTAINKLRGAVNAACDAIVLNGAI